MLFVLGNFHSPAVNWTAVANPAPNRELYFMSQYPSLESSLEFFWSDYTASYSISNAFDLAVQEKALGLAGSEYAGLCALATRQVFGGIEVTIGKDAQGNYNKSDVMVFMKVFPCSCSFASPDSCELQCII